MASKRSLMAFVAVVFLLPSCTLVRMSKKDSSSEKIYSDKGGIESVFSNESIISSLQSVYEPPIEWIPSYESSDNQIPFDAHWEICEIHEEEGESNYAIRSNIDTLDQAIVFDSESFVEVSDGFDFRWGYGLSEFGLEDAFKPTRDDMWLEYRISLTEEVAMRFTGLPLVLYGGYDNSVASDSQRYPSCFELVVNGVTYLPSDLRPYAEIELNYLGSSQSVIFWSPGINVPLIEGMNTIRYIRKASGGLYISEFWITGFPMPLEPEL